MEVGEKHLVTAYQVIFGLDRFLDFDDHLGNPVDIFYCREDLGANGLVFGIAETGAFSGGCLHVDLMAVGDEFFRSGGGSRCS